MIPYFEINSFNLGPFKIYSWGVFVALAFLVGLILGIRGAKKIRVEPHKITYLIIFVYIGAIIGSRLFFVLQWPKDFLANPLEIFKITQGGLMLYGGLLGGLSAGWLYLRKSEYRWQLISVLTPIIPLCMAIGRIGCFLTNDHQGGLTNLPWAIRWPDGTLRHPVALYLILFDLVLAGFLWWWNRRHSEAEGRRISHECGTQLPAYAGDTSPRQGGVQDDKKIFVLFLILYAAGRFLLDFTRDASADPHYWGLATSQWISAILLTLIFTYIILIKLIIVSLKSE